MRLLRHIQKVLPVLLCLTVFVVRGAGVKITQSGNGNYSVGQVFTVVIDAEGVRNLNNLPGLKGCEIVRRMSSQSHSLTYDAQGNTVLSGNIRLTLSARAMQPGSYTFGPFNIGNVRSNVIKYNVSAGGGSGSNIPSSSMGSPVAPTPTFSYSDNGEMMLKATVSASSVYVQQPFVYTVRLYSLYPIRYPDQVEDPKMDNGVFEVIAPASPTVVTQTSINGKQYYTVELYSLLVYPTKPGDINITGGSVGYLSGGFGGPTGAKANDVKVAVKEWPDMAQHSDVNGVGVYKVSAELANNTVRAGEPIHLSITVSGRGNPAFVSLPDIASCLPENLKFIKSESKVDKDISGNDTEGKVTFDCVVMASKEGQYEIPALTFTFFNPSEGKWYTQSTATIKIEVEEGGQLADSHSLTFDSDLQTCNKAVDSYEFYISTALYWLIYVLLVGVLILAVIYRQKRIVALADSVSTKRKQAGAVARKRLKLADKAMKNNDKSLFYSELLTALWGYLSDKLSIPVSELSRLNIQERVLEACSDELLSREIIDFIDECEFAKYGNAGDTDMSETYSNASALLDKIEATIKKQPHSDENI